jgi:hypothetical protein
VLGTCLGHMDLTSDMYDDSYKLLCDILILHGMLVVSELLSKKNKMDFC